MQEMGRFPDTMDPGRMAELAADEDTLRHLLERFAERLRGDPPAIAAAIESGDAAEAQRLVHSLKSVAGTLGANEVSKRAGRTEAQLRDAEPDVGLEALNRECSRSADAIGRWLESDAT